MLGSRLGKIIFIAFIATLILNLWPTDFVSRFQQDNVVLHFYELVPNDYEKKIRVQRIIFHNSKTVQSTYAELLANFHELNSE